MRVAILDDRPALSAYVGEILHTWGACFFGFVEPGAIDSLDPADAPVLICPRRRPDAAADTAIIAYAQRGGTVICMAPAGELAAAAGVADRGEKPAPLRLRPVDVPAPGLTGEHLPVVGHVRDYERSDEQTRVLAYLVHPERFNGESPGLTERSLGRGRILAFAFDLPLSVLLLRQGDPKFVGVVPPEAGPGIASWPCVSNLACDIGPRDAGWIPFADLLARLLVEIALQHLPGPAPRLSHLPGEAPSVVLYSGDEDKAELSWIEEEFGEVTAAGARMNLYIMPLPEETHSQPTDARRYLERHDLGPHPNLRRLDDRPIPERLAEYERQVRLFESRYGVKARTVRNHCLTWVGYTELAELQERLGIRMDANFVAGGGFGRHRTFAPYSDFGAAMPMRFCRLDGRLIDVFQQHFHVEDDSWFSDWIGYSAKLSPRQYEPLIERCLDDAIRFETPWGNNFHPSNWVKFSGEQGRHTIRAAKARGIPVWSFDQWCDFWSTRATWRFEELAWDGRTLSFVAAGDEGHDALRLALPEQHGDLSLREARVDTARVELTKAKEGRSREALVTPPAVARRCRVVAVYA